MFPWFCSWKLSNPQLKCASILSRDKCIMYIWKIKIMILCNWMTHLVIHCKHCLVMGVLATLDLISIQFLPIIFKEPCYGWVCFALLWMGMVCMWLQDLYHHTCQIYCTHVQDVVCFFSTFNVPDISCLLVFCTINTCLLGVFFCTICLHNSLHFSSILFKSCNVLFNLNRQEQNAVF